MNHKSAENIYISYSIVKTITFISLFFAAVGFAGWVEGQ